MYTKLLSCLGRGVWLVGAVVVLTACADAPAPGSQGPRQLDGGADADGSSGVQDSASGQDGNVDVQNNGTDSAIATDSDTALWLPNTCWTGPADCDPRSNGGCTAPGSACDLAENDQQQLTLTCFDPPNTAAAGAKCNTATGPFCQGGLGCGPEGVCAAFCCDNASCNTAKGEECEPLVVHWGSLGLCRVLPTDCAGAGKACSKDGDCCSGECHGSHCH
jgi:hypothetical protein